MEFESIAGGIIGAAVIGGAVGFAAKGILMGGNPSNQKQNNEELLRDIERYKKRIKEMDEQIEKLVAAAERHRKEEREDSDEIEELEDELIAAKNKVKTLQALNTQYESQIRDLRDSNASLKAELDEERRSN